MILNTQQKCMQMCGVGAFLFCHAAGQPCEETDENEFSDFGFGDLFDAKSLEDIDNIANAALTPKEGWFLCCS